MTQLKTSDKWIEAGYELFANEGPEAIQVERLGRILNLNKSGFYHYFLTRENFIAELVAYHHKMAALYIHGISCCRNIDPDYIYVIINLKMNVIFHMRLVQNRDNPLFSEAYKNIDLKIDHAILPIWSDFIGIPQNPILAFQYYGIVRDMFLSRVTLNNFTYAFLHEVLVDAKLLVKKILSEN
jgi:AcrR family transcriptional regulator